eukprot:symbB.v1.2.007862.t5/scaffold448.1/size203282/14
MVVAYDTLFSHEYRNRLLEKSPLRRWIHKIRSNGVEIGVIWLLLIICGFRKSRKAVHRALRNGSQYAREGSRTALQQMGKAVRRTLAVDARGTATNSSDFNANSDGSQRNDLSPAKLSGREQLLGFLLKNMDTILVGFLGYKLLLLVLYTMPITYGFGIKTAFLKWASKAHLFRLYLRSAPFVCLGIVGAATAAVHYGNATDAIGRGTISRWRALGLLNGILTYCTARLFELIRGDYKPFVALEESAQERDLLAFEPPAKGTALLKMMQVLFWPQRAFTPPQLFGAEELGNEKRRLLFVGNHAILGIDVPLLLYCLYDGFDIWPRPLGEHAWFSVPVIGELMYSIGAVDGTRRNCDLLMEQGCCVLVYPGGAREAWKRTTDKPYEILWGENHVGFVRMAVRHGYTIVPVATVGTEDVVRPVMDVPIREVLTAGGILKPPESSSKAFEDGARQEEDLVLLRKLRDVTKQRLQEGIDWLLTYRESDPQRFVFRSNSTSSPSGQLSSRKSQKMLMMPPKLSIEKVFGEMKAIAHASGKDSQKAKKEKIQKLLVASRGEEAKFIVRMLQAKLRIGIQIPTLLQALAYAFTLTLPGPSAGQAKATDRRVGQGKLSPGELESQMIAMEAAVRQAFSEMPNFDNLINALMEGRNSRSLLEVCRISLGVPVKPMLAKPSKGIAEVGERLSGKRFTGEWKYDGERAQIHVLSRDKIQIYSRNSENMTEKYPDVIQVVKDTLAQDVESCIIDSELVAYDQVNKKILPFQVLTTRGRKNINVEDIKVNVCLFAFDCMLLNGKPLVKEPLEVRREQLWKMLAPKEGKVTFAVHKNFDDINEEEIQAFLDESVAGSCEGLMLKTLTDNATYEPSKRSLNWLKLKKDLNAECL